MESIASKLRSAKFHQEDSKNFVHGKDASKRFGDALPDVGGKKRILGDITNKVAVVQKVKNNKLGSKKDQKKVFDDSAVNISFLKNKSTNDLSLKSEDSSLYVSALEINDSAIDVNDIKEELEDVATPSIFPSLPEGVEDFDKTCLEDPFCVTDYVVDIFQYYKEREKHFVFEKYLNKQTELTKSMRAILVDWMVEVQESFELNHETLYLAVKLVDYYLMRQFVAKTKLQLIGVTAVFIAAKFDERMPPLADDFLYICDDSYTRHELLLTEVKILKAINFDLGFPLSYRFLRRYARCSRLSMELLTLARFILETALMDYELIEVVDSKLAAAALLLSLKMEGKKWSPTLEYYSGYKEEDLSEIIIPLNDNISGPPSKHLQTIRTKYSHPIFFEVAKIKPLKRSITGQLVKV